MVQKKDNKRYKDIPNIYDLKKINTKVTRSLVKYEYF